jgi:hypothetical protein
MNNNGDDDEDFVGKAIVDTAISLVEQLFERGISPGDALKTLTTAIVLIIQNADFEMSKVDIAGDITRLITAIATAEDAKEDNEDDEDDDDE